MKTLFCTVALATLMVACSKSEPTPVDTAAAEPAKEAPTPDADATPAEDNAKAEPASKVEVKYYVIGEG